MGHSYYRWSTDSDIPLFLQLIDTTQVGSTGKSPEVSIRRLRLLDGTVLDGWFWNGTAFTATPVWFTMSEFDATNWPGLYLYDFEQTLIAISQIYIAYYRHTSAPVGFNIEQHIVTDELFIPTSSPAVPILPGDTVMGRLEDMEDPVKAVALANADAVWDELVNQHLDPGSTGEALSKCASQFIGLRQIDITVEDDLALPIQGAVVDVFNDSNTLHLGRAFTDTNGKVTIALDDGTYNIRLFASGFSFTVPEILVVTADASVTFTGTALNIIIPPIDPNKCLIFGSVDDAGGNKIAGACVEAFAETPQVVSGFQKSERVASTLTDTNGAFQIELVRLTSVRFRITDPDGEIVLEEIRIVPDLATQDLATWT